MNILKKSEKFLRIWNPKNSGVFDNSENPKLKHVNLFLHYFGKKNWVLKGVLMDKNKLSSQWNAKVCLFSCPVFTMGRSWQEGSACACKRKKKLARHAWQISAVQISLGSRVKILLKLTMCKMEESSLVRWRWCTIFAMKIQVFANKKKLNLYFVDFVN